MFLFCGTTQITAFLYMLWFKFNLGLKFFELVSILHLQQLDMLHHLQQLDMLLVTLS